MQSVLEAVQKFNADCYGKSEKLLLFSEVSNACARGFSSNFVILSFSTGFGREV